MIEYKMYKARVKIKESAPDNIWYSEYTGCEFLVQYWEDDCYELIEKEVNRVNNDNNSDWDGYYINATDAVIVKDMGFIVKRVGDY